MPEDILSMLNDSTLFSQNSELTTKDILKRYGEIVNRPTPMRTTAPPSATPPQTKDGRPPVTPTFQRVDEHPSQNLARQKESASNIEAFSPNGNRETMYSQRPHEHDRGDGQANLQPINPPQPPPPIANPQWDRRGGQPPAPVGAI